MESKKREKKKRITIMILSLQMQPKVHAAYLVLEKTGL